MATQAVRAATDPRRDPAAEEQRRLNGIRAAIRDGATGLALTLIDQWLATAPGRGDLHVLKGAAFEQEGRPESAKTEFLRAAELLPRSLEPLVRAAKLSRDLGQPAEELRLLRSAVHLDPANQKLLRRVLDLEWDMRDFASAVATANRVLALAAGDVDVTLRKIWSLYEHGEKRQAEALLSAHLRRTVPQDAYVLAWTELLVDREDRAVEAEAALIDLCAKIPNSWVPWACLGKVAHKLEKVEAALQAFRRTVEIKPDHGVVWFDIGVIERQVGREAEAAKAFERALQLDPLNASSLRIHGYEHRYAYGDESFKRVNRAVARAHVYPDKLKVEVHYAAAKAFEDVKELEAAFDHYQRAGALQKQLTPWSELTMNGVLSLLRQFISRDALARAREEGYPTNQPAFIVGMPRSGTTLIEQVAASHPQVFGAGEQKLGAAAVNGITIGKATIETSHFNSFGQPGWRQLATRARGEAYLAALRNLAGGDYARIVDKMPGNFYWTGLLDVILPGCFIIHSRRHPVDTCLSQYRIFFPDGIPYSYDLRDLGRAYRQYLNFMKYWSAMLPKERILHVRYEDMVMDFETQARRLVDYLKLPWDDACLKFYQTERSVKTASVAQVRKPIYADSINRWRRYEAHLKPLIEELGPLIEDYEAELRGERPSPFD
jgi:tetratricopeptide (TPR) repeat protein